MSNLRDALSKYFETFDSLREELNRTLDGWDTPVVVVFGPQNAGKSTLLERLAMMPLFPKGEGLCTRVPIRIRLRSGVDQAPELGIYSREGGEERIDSQTLYGNVEHSVSKIMANLMSIQKSGARGVRSDRLIQVELRGPRYPNIDLLDIPGLVVAPGPGDAPDLAEQTYSLAKKVIKEMHGRAIFLAVREAGHDTRQSLTTRLLSECPEIRPISFGVLTKCDRSSDDKIVEELHASTEWDLGLGYFATMNKSPQTNGGLDALRAAEQEWFAQTTVRRELLESGRAGSDHLVQHLADAYHDYLKKTWVPNTLKEIERSKSLRNAELIDLGVPRGGDPTPELIDAVTQTIELAHRFARNCAMEACIQFSLSAKVWRGEDKPKHVDVARRGADLAFPLDAFINLGLDEKSGIEAQLRDGATALTQSVMETPEYYLMRALENDRPGGVHLEQARVARFKRLLARVLTSCGTQAASGHLADEIESLIESFLQRNLEYSSSEVTLRGFDRIRHELITCCLRELSLWSPPIDVEAWAKEDPFLFEDSSAPERAACIRRLNDLDHARTWLNRLFAEVPA
jgi:hypothetical protein